MFDKWNNQNLSLKNNAEKHGANFKVYLFLPRLSQRQQEQRKLPKKYIVQLNMLTQWN